MQRPQEGGLVKRRGGYQSGTSATIFLSTERKLRTKPRCSLAEGLLEAQCNAEAGRSWDLVYEGQSRPEQTRAGQSSVDRSPKLQIANLAIASPASPQAKSDETRIARYSLANPDRI
ncbi:hypothetical protein NPX13_g8517 [Xylaria arbuscula]|uniref:Uncharacterized protein n=1 Tax=Xylaria arbuscula TaxID=114810 RepID=A0A9W8N893_9PEZI|nr:hypothetical protein NPX13_g8517 [Xylaria arbuscula]